MDRTRFLYDVSRNAHTCITHVYRMSRCLIWNIERKRKSDMTKGIGSGVGREHIDRYRRKTIFFVECLLSEKPLEHTNATQGTTKHTHTHTKASRYCVHCMLFAVHNTEHTICIDIRNQINRKSISSRFPFSCRTSIDILLLLLCVAVVCCC